MHVSRPPVGFDNDTTTFTIAGGAGTGGSAQDAEGAHWLLWKGAWGDQEYPEDDDRQYCVFDISCHYVNGPTGKRIFRLTGRGWLN